MSVALFVSLIYFLVLLFFPYINPERANSSYSVLGMALHLYKDELAVAIFAAVVVLLALIGVITALLKKNKASGVFTLISCIAVFASYALMPSAIEKGSELIASIPLSSIVNPTFILFSIIAFVLSMFCIKSPDAYIGSKPAAVPAYGAAMSRSTYPQISAAPVRQNMYAAPAPAPTPAPAPAPTPAPATAPVSAASMGGTYTCPVCSTTQKSDLAFCTFCGNPNPNKQ